MKCEICGSEIEPGSRRCKYCGHELHVPEPVNNDTEEHTYEEPVVPHQSDTERRPIYCAQCGSRLDPETFECPICGVLPQDREKEPEKVVIREPEPIPPAEPPHSAKPVSPKKKHTVRNIVLIVLLLVILFAASFSVFFKLLGGSFTEEAESTESPAPTTENVISTPEAVQERATQRPSQTSAPRTTNAPRATPRPTANTNARPTPRRDESEDTPKREENNTDIEQSIDELLPSDLEDIDPEQIEGMTKEKLKRLYDEYYAKYGEKLKESGLAQYLKEKGLL